MEKHFNQNTITMENISTKVFIESSEVPWENNAPGMKRKIMAYDESLMLVRVEFEKGAVGALHSHYHTQITHVGRGVFEVEISGEKKMLRAGDVFYVPPHAIHGAVCIEPGVLIDVFSPMREDFIQPSE